MERRIEQGVSLVAVGVVACLATGCSQGSGVPFPTSAQTTAPATVATATSEAVALGFTSTEVGGDVNALGVTSSGAVLAARGSDVVRVIPGAEPQRELALGSEPTSFATVGEQVYVATSAPTGGALLVRDEIEGEPRWTALLETDAANVSVASVGSTAVVLTGGGGFDGEILHLRGDGSMVSLARFPATTPTQAVEFRGALFVAGVVSMGGGVATASLGRIDVDQDLPVVLALPLVTNYDGPIEQRIAGLGVRATDEGDELMVVVGERDPVNGQELGGFAAVSDGETVRVVAEFNHEPRGAAFVEAQPYVGLADGQLITSQDGSWREVTGLPATLGIETLTVSGSTLWVAARGANGARLFSQAAPSDEFKNLPRGFVDGVHGLLSASCTPCHADPSRPFRLGVDSETDFGSTLSFVDRDAPESSLLVTKATGSTSHGGGAVLSSEDPRHADLVAWIEQGAPREAGEVTYTEHVAPIFAAVNCVRCHDLASNRPYLMSTSGDLDVDYRITLAYMNADDPEQSELLLRTSATLPHPAQGIPNPSPRRDVLLRWVADGMQRGPDPQ